MSNSKNILKPDKADIDKLEEFLVSGIREYMKIGFKRIHLGLSGGIDSALAACLAVKAAGAENVTCLNMPSRFSSQASRDDAAALVANLGCQYESLPIEECYAAFLSALKGIFKDLPFDTAEENIQTRIRGVLAMAYSNKFNSMLISASNKSEIAMGYCTLYGVDTIGVLAPIGGIFKTQVYALCRRINELSLEGGGEEIIPQVIIDKPPSAELRPNQKDEDSLPPYDVLDPILDLYLCEKNSAEEIISKGWDRDLVNRIIKTVTWAEFKARQLPPVLTPP